jgi:hypothetical protein
MEPARQFPNGSDSRTYLAAAPEELERQANQLDLPAGDIRAVLGGLKELFTFGRSKKCVFAVPSLYSRG